MRTPLSSRPAGTAAFTLVELLVVVAILGVLASLLLPSLAGARQCAQSARCASNLRQFGLAAQMYWDDNDGAAFRYRGGETNGGDLFWFGWLERGEEGERGFDPTLGTLWPHLASRAVQACPSLRTAAPGFKAKARGGACGYGYNLALSSPPGQPPLRMTSLARPAETAVFADAAQVNDFQPPATPVNPLLEEFYYVNATEPTAHFRHRERALVVFADTHVSRRRPANGSLDPRLPAARVGRLPASVLEPR